MNKCNIIEVRTSSASEFIKSHPKEGKFFFRLEEQEWREAVRLLRTSTLIFLTMWCDQEDICILFLEDGFRPLGVKTVSSTGRYLAVSSVKPAAMIYERIILDLWGKEAMNALDLRPWIDRGVWDKLWPLSQQPGPTVWPPEPYEYNNVPHLLDKGGDIAVIDPSSCNGISPSLWRFSILGDKIIRAETLYGYTHRGILSSFKGQNILDVLPKISRINAVDSVAHQVAFSHAVEDIAKFLPSGEVLRKRVVLLELSRISAHLLYLSMLFRALDVKIIASRYEIAREHLMRWSSHYYGHRWLMDCVYPGTIRHPEDDEVKEALPENVKYLYFEAKKIVEGFSGLVDAIKGIGILSTDRAIELNIGGVIGRASGRGIDIRRYMPEYQLHWLSSQNYNDGDVYARLQLRLQEIEDSFNIIENILDFINVENYSATQQQIIVESLHGEGVGVCEGAHGDLWYYIRLEAGKIKDFSIRDPATNQAYVLQEILSNTKWHDQAIIRASFGIMATGADF